MCACVYVCVRVLCTGGCAYDKIFIFSLSRNMQCDNANVSGKEINTQRHIQVRCQRAPGSFECDIPFVNETRFNLQLSQFHRSFVLLYARFAGDRAFFQRSVSLQLKCIIKLRELALTKYYLSSVSFILFSFRSVFSAVFLTFLI